MARGGSRRRRDVRRPLLTSALALLAAGAIAASTAQGDDGDDELLVVPPPGADAPAVVPAPPPEVAAPPTTVAIEAAPASPAPAAASPAPVAGGTAGAGPAPLAFDLPAEVVPGPPPTTALPASPCGAPVARPGGGTWECTFADDFDGTELDRTKWVPQETEGSGYTSRNECFLDRPENVHVAGGVLRLVARREPRPFVCPGLLGEPYLTSHSSGMVSTYGLFSQAFGRFEFRARFPDTSVPGLHSALWLWPDDPMHYGPWPMSGEIDVAEVFSQYADRAIPYIHYFTLLPERGATNNFCMVDRIGDFHTYVLEWTEQEMFITYDGVPCLAHRWRPLAPAGGSAPFDQPFMVILTQALGQGTNAFSGRTPLPAVTEVDHVRVWR